MVAMEWRAEAARCASPEPWTGIEAGWVSIRGWLDPSMASVGKAPVEGEMPPYGRIGDIAGKWSA
jgi:hypothetical protein